MYIYTYIHILFIMNKKYTTIIAKKIIIKMVDGL